MSLAGSRVQLGVDEFCLGAFQCAEVEGSCEGDISLLEPAVRLPDFGGRPGAEIVRRAAKSGSSRLREGGCRGEQYGQQTDKDGYVRLHDSSFWSDQITRGLAYTHGPPRVEVAHHIPLLLPSSRELPPRVGFTP